MNMVFRLLLAFLLFTQTAFATIEFDGAETGGDVLSCGTGNTVTNGNMTISAWIYQTGNGGNSLPRIFQRDTAASTAQGIALYVNNNGAIDNALGFLATGTTNLVQESASNVFANSTWTHVLATWTGSTTATNAHIYVNGVEVSSGTPTNGASLHTVDNNNWIGNRGDVARTWQGKITDVATWNVVLTSQEILQLAKSRVKRMPLQVQPSALTAYLPLDEEENNTPANADVFRDLKGVNNCTGDDGTNNTGLVSFAEEVLSYP